MKPLSALHRRAADATSLSSTACRSKVERLMTLSTSAVAVCCCSDSRSSLSSRVFSMAMTACAGEVFDKLDLLVRERPDFLPIDGNCADQLILLDHRGDKERASTGEVDESDDEGIAFAVRRHRPKVVDVHDLLGPEHLSMAAPRRGTECPCLGVCRRNIVERNLLEAVSVIEIQQAELRVAQPRGVRQHGLEYRFKLAGRARDDTEDLRGRGLLLQQLAQLVEQPGVLDGDDGLLGKIANKLNMLVVERPHFLAIDGDRADELVLLEHRYVDHGSSAGQVGEPHQRRLALDVSPVCPDVGNVYRLLRSKQALEGTVRARTDHRVAPRQLSPCPRCVVQRNASEGIAIVQ